LYDHARFLGGVFAVSDDREEAEVGVGCARVIGVGFDVRFVDDGEVDEERFDRPVVLGYGGGVVWCGCVPFVGVVAVSRNFLKQVVVEYRVFFLFGRLTGSLFPRGVLRGACRVWLCVSPRFGARSAF